MGSVQENLKKDPNIDIQLTLDKYQFMTGKQATGSITIQAKTHLRLYKNLYLRLQGHQRNKQYSLTKQNKQTYRDQIIIANFPDGLKNGIHVFPFSFVIPLSFPGSYYQNPQTYIKYQLTARLASVQQTSKDQWVKQELLLVESLRSQSKEIVFQQKKQFNFIFFGGIVNVNFFINKNVVTAGESLKIKGTIDNTKNGFELNSIAFAFQQIKVKAHGSSQIKRRQLLNPFSLLWSLQPNGIKQFQLDSKIPSFENSTAIGCYNCIYHRINFSVKSLCCSNFECNIPIIFHTNNAKYINPSNGKLQRNKTLKTYKNHAVKYSSLRQFQREGPNFLYPFSNLSQPQKKRDNKYTQQKETNQQYLPSVQNLYKNQMNPEKFNK